MKKCCIQVNRQFGEKLRLLLVKWTSLDQEYPITSDDGNLLFPLTASLTKAQLLELQKRKIDFTLIDKDLEPINQKPHDLATALEKQIPLQHLKNLPHSFDIIGDIAIIELVDTLEPYEKEIGKAIMIVNPKVTTVFSKAGPVTGLHRLRPLRHIAGLEKTHTIHVEYGIRLAIDVAQTYFSPRLSTEHNRIASLVQPTECIIDLFTGVGPFALFVANTQPVTVYAIDINKQAIRCLQRSLELNQLKGEIVPIVGDCRRIVQDRLWQHADRIIMNLPHNAFSYLDVAAAAIKPGGGHIHFYGIITEQDPLDSLSDQVIAKLADLKRTARVMNSRRVRPAAPHEFQVVLDIVVDPEDTEMTT